MSTEKNNFTSSVVSFGAMYDSESGKCSTRGLFRDTTQGRRAGTLDVVHEASNTGKNYIYIGSGRNGKSATLTGFNLPR